MKLKELCQAAALECPGSGAETKISAIAMDSGRVTKGSLFVCIRGLHTDGHTYIGEAIAKGAVAVLCETGREPAQIPTVYSDNPRRAAARLYNAFWGNPVASLKFIGVTGTNGKTTVTHMLRAILESSMYRTGLIGTVGCESCGRHLAAQNRDPLANMTTPDPPDLYRMLREMVDDGVEYVLMEVTSHALALGKLDPIRFAAGIFTNLTPEHLDYHGNMMQYAAAKAKLFKISKISVINADDSYGKYMYDQATMDAYADAKAELFRRSALAIVNTDSPYGERMRRAAAGRCVTCSAVGRPADYRAENLRLASVRGVEYELHSGNTRMKISCPIPGGFTVMNSMQAAACAIELGIGPSSIQDALASMTGVRGRMERVRLGVGADFSVLIDYAHTPDALEKLLRTARDSCTDGQRVVLLFGCGGDRDRSKRAMMGGVAELYADRVIVTSDNSRSENPQAIIADILAGMRQGTAEVIPDRAEAIRHAVLTAEKNDLILLAGKGHEEYEIDRTGRHRFSERELVQSACEERRRRARDD